VKETGMAGVNIRPDGNRRHIYHIDFYRVNPTSSSGTRTENLGNNCI
jgi:hypothetical protein